MKHVFLFSLIFFLSPLLASSNVDSLLKELDNVLKNKTFFEKTRLEHIDNLKSLVTDTDLSTLQNFHVNRRIIADYQPYNFDSTLVYIKKNIYLSNLLKDVELRAISQLDYAALLSSSGRYVEALGILEDANKQFLTKDECVLLHKTYERIYSDLYIYASSEEVKSEFKRLSNMHIDSLIGYLEPNTDAFLAIKEKKYRDARQLDLCEKVNSQRLAIAQTMTRLYSTITFERSLIYELQKNVEDEKKYLILSAISDTKAAVKDNASLTRLALILYKEGDIDRAYAYIQHSFEDANFYNSRLRFISISNILPLITEAYQTKTDSQRKKLFLFTVSVSVLSILLLLLLLFSLRQMSRISKARQEIEMINQQYVKLNEDLQESNEKLKDLNNDYIEASQVKEHYIGSFLSICSDYIDKLDNYRKMVNREIKAQKVEELFRKTRSSQLLEEEMAEFYANFDNVFLHIYPHFVEEFNKLLKDDARIILKKENALNTELRIFALIRLGISDSSSIAKLLRYSTSTIYNYRVKTRNNASVPRDEFKDHVMKIHASM